MQLAVQDGAPAENLRHALELIERAPASDLYLLPELWSTGYAHASWADAARDHTPGIVRALQEVADRRGAWVGGSLVSQTDGGGLANRLWLLAPGAPPVCYDKTHLFAPMGEPGRLVGGPRRVATEVAGAPAALSICFDLRFPEQYRQDALGGAELFVVSSAWPHPRSEALRLFARARAAENQAYLVLCNRAGPGADGTSFCGGSAIIAPDGSVVAETGDEETVLTGEVNVAAVGHLRAQFPVLPRRVAGVDY